ncbi:MAG: GAF domain-containing protein [Deltaproteobacteria bacterium]|nr:GAF domain-containing protein [Deltaproteobacteria bacterium]
MTRLTDKDVLRAVLNRQGVVVFAYDTDGTITFAQGKGDALVEGSPSMLVGHSAFEVVPHNSPENIDHLKMALAGEEFTAIGRFKEDSVFIEGSFTPIRDQFGKVVEVLGLTFDVTERERAKRERDVLIEIGKALTEAPTLEAGLDHVCRLMLSVLCDYCMIDLADKDGRLQQASVAHVDPIAENRLFELQRRYSFEFRPDYLPFRVFTSGETVLFPEITDEIIAAHAHDERELALFRALEPKSCVLIPLRARGRSLGVLTLVRTASPCRYGEPELPLLTEVARRVALSIENERLNH